MKSAPATLLMRMQAARLISLPLLQNSGKRYVYPSEKLKYFKQKYCRFLNLGLSNKNSVGYLISLE